MKRYQIFISSTYVDLKEERATVVESILKLRHIPVGMEQFVATNDAQFNYIKRVIDETDYYVLIVGNRYGSVASDGISYTEKEFDYAVSKGLPILAFIHSNPEIISSGKSDSSQKAKKQLVDFKSKVSDNRLVSLFKWETPDKLAKEVVVALTNAFTDTPRPGWERITSYDNSELLEQINNLRIENTELKAKLEDYESSNNDASVVENFAWDENIHFIGRSKWSDYENLGVPISCSWRQLYTLWGPFLVGKTSSYSCQSSLSRAIFGDKPPYWQVGDDDYGKIKFTLWKIGVIEVFDDTSKDEYGERVRLTSIGKKFLLQQPYPEQINLDAIDVINTSSQTQQTKNQKKLESLIHELSNFNSNPEAINYIGQTLIDANAFLTTEKVLSQNDLALATRLIDEVLAEAASDDRPQQGTFDPIFNLHKINRLIKVLINNKNSQAIDK